jgi:hypothetical protein
MQDTRQTFLKTREEEEREGDRKKEIKERESVQED